MPHWLRERRQRYTRLSRGFRESQRSKIARTSAKRFTWRLTLDFTLYTLHTPLYTLHSSLYTPYFIRYTLHSSLLTAHFTLHTPYFTLHTLHFTLYTLHSTLYTLRFTRYTLHSTLTLHTLHFKLYTWHSTLPHLTPFTLRAPLFPNSYLKEPHSTLPAHAPKSPPKPPSCPSNLPPIVHPAPKLQSVPFVFLPSIPSLLPLLFPSFSIVLLCFDSVFASFYPPFHSLQMHVGGRTRGESNPTVTQLPPGTSASKSTTVATRIRWGSASKSSVWRRPPPRPPILTSFAMSNLAMLDSWLS